MKLVGKKNEDGTYEYRTNGAMHTHIIDARDQIVKEQLKQRKEAAKTTSNVTRELLADGLGDLQEEIIAEMPSAAAFSKTMRRQRKNDHPRAPDSLTGFVIPKVLTASNEDFLMLDNGPEADERVIILGTKRAMDFMATCSILHMDGTVSSAPALFDQIYMIHGNYLIVIHFGKMPQFTFTK